MSSHQVRNVSFYPDGVQVDFATPVKDLRSNGLFMQHSITIPATEEYAERLDNLVDAVSALLEGALDDFTTHPAAADVVDHEQASPYDNPLERDGVLVDTDDDEPGPYDNPLERPVVPFPEQD